MPRNRQTTVAVCAISWSLLFVQILTITSLRTLGASPSSNPAWSWLPRRISSIIWNVQPGFTGIAVLILFVLAIASTAELAIEKWGVAEDEEDVST